MPQIRPMKAIHAPEDLSSLPFPLWASTKLDGIRCIIKDGVAYSNSLKPIRNRFVQAELGKGLNGLDGELIVGDPNAWDCMRKTNSGIMSFDGEPDFKFHVFDRWDRAEVDYMKTYERISSICHPRVELVYQRGVIDTAGLEALERSVLDDGYEGLILRRPYGMYKYGRSTLREGYLIKLKRYHQAEATIVDTTPLLRNLNPPELNELGYTHRSAAQGGKMEMPLLGALVVKGFFDGAMTEFEIGTGFTMAERDRFWRERESLIGKFVTYKFFPTGSKDRPRHPVFISFRDADDL